MKKAVGPSELFIFEEDEMLLFQPGDLTAIITEEIDGEPALSVEEESQITKCKDLIHQYIQEYESKKQVYSSMISPKAGVEVTIMLQSKATGTIHKAGPEDLKRHCQTARGNVEKYAKFLGGKASLLFKKGHLNRAYTEFAIARDALIKVYGPNHAKTLGLTLDYGLTLNKDGDEQGIVIIKDVIQKLEKELNQSDCSKDIKKIIAIADLALARHYLSHNGKLNDALLHVDRSEKLRREYTDDPTAMDRVKFLRASIESARGDINNAKKLFIECYKFRAKTNGEYDCELIPPLESLIIIAGLQNKNDQKIIYLKRLREIKIRLMHSPREIINVELEIIQAMFLETSEEEWWSVMNSVQEKLDQIKVTAESAAVGFNYLTLAETRLSTILPHEWPVAKKIKFYVDTNALLHKAGNHLNQEKSQDKKIQWQKRMKNAEERCRLRKEFFESPELYLFEDNPVLNNPEENLLVELQELSDFSSEVRQSLVDASERVLTIEEFAQLPEKGTINPFRLRTAQGGINSEFRDKQSLEQAKQQLVANPQYTNQIPAVQIGVHQGKVYSFDTRRLIVHQQAREDNQNVLIRYEKISGAYLEERIKAIFSPRPWNGLVTALRYEGKNSESVPYINPAYRNQLEQNVSKGFINWPSERQKANADANGFCIMKAKAKKIYTFLCQRKNTGSETAKKIVEETLHICDIKGKNASYEFLTAKKIEMDLAGEDLVLEGQSSKSSERRFSI